MAANLWNHLLRVNQEINLNSVRFCSFVQSVVQTLPLIDYALEMRRIFTVVILFYRGGIEKVLIVVACWNSIIVLLLNGLIYGIKSNIIAHAMNQIIHSRANIIKLRAAMTWNVCRHKFPVATSPQRAEQRQHINFARKSKVELNGVVSCGSSGIRTSRTAAFKIPAKPSSR